MHEHPWPLKNTLPERHVPFTKADLFEFLADVADDSPIWIDNYRQIRHGITQRPVDVMTRWDDGIHLG